MRSMSTVYRAILIVSIAALMIWGWSFLLPRFSDWLEAEPESAAGTPEPAEMWTVTHIHDGDSFEAERDGVVEEVRVIGIDTPEQGECGADMAREAAETTLLGNPVELIPGTEDDRDSYGRLLRYVQIGQDDYGLEMITYGFAIARYDSRTGQPHDREDEYRAADEEFLHMCAGFDGAAG